MMNDDWTLGARAANGDDAAFLELYERNVVGIVGLLRDARPQPIAGMKDQARLELTDRLASAAAVCGEVRRLPHEQQGVIILSLLVGADDEEIAEWLSQGTDDVRRIRLAAQRALRHHLQQQEPAARQAPRSAR